MAHHYNPTVVGITVALHLTWATGLFFEPSAINATALHTMLILTGDPFLSALIFGMVAILAMLGILTNPLADRILLILPQHLVLWVSTVGVFYAMYMGQFADGVPRSHWFLIVDQIPVVLLAFGHTVALILMARGHHG